MNIHVVTDTRIEAALAHPEVKALAADLRRAGITLKEPISASVASRAMSAAGFDAVRRIAVKATLSRYGLLSDA